MRYPVSGVSTVAISPATASSNQSIGVSITSGRVFWLRGVWTTPNATTGPVHVVDATVGSTATSPTLAIPLEHDSATKVVGPRTIFEYPAPGIKFSTNPVARMSASGSIDAGHIGCWGYEE